MRDFVLLTLMDVCVTKMVSSFLSFDRVKICIVVMCLSRARYPQQSDATDGCVGARQIRTRRVGRDIARTVREGFV